MFSKGYEIAAKFTFPIITNVHFFNKSIESGLGAFVLLNDEGWIMTVAHNLSASFAFNQHQLELKEYNENIEKINANKQLKQGQRNALLRATKSNPKWVTGFTTIFGQHSNLPILEYYVYGEHDIAFLRVDPKTFVGHTVFPKIKMSKNIKSGTSLCKLGYPFIEIKSTFDEKTNTFILPNLDLALFPIEGIFTRWLLFGKASDGTAIKYLETSSPGLRGQSGGPIFDVNGNLYGIQSKNLTIDMGFKGNVKINGKTIEENQFLNVGIGVSTETIESLLTKHKIKFEAVE